jgi:hypothetical protein
MHQCSPPLRNHHLFPYHHDLNVNVNQNNISNVSQMPLNSSSGMILESQLMSRITDRSEFDQSQWQFDW